MILIRFIKKRLEFSGFRLKLPLLLDRLITENRTSMISLRALITTRDGFFLLGLQATRRPLYLMLLIRKRARSSRKLHRLRDIMAAKLTGNLLSFKRNKNMLESFFLQIN